MVSKMKRRTLLRTVGAGFMAAGAGCLGTGGKVVHSVTESVRVEPGHGWSTEIPDVSDPGGAIRYVIKSEDEPFDVYFFTEKSQFDAYQAFLDGDEPAETPNGHDRLSKTGVGKEGENADGFVASTSDDGAREPLDVEGPYYLVVDHSSYRYENRVDMSTDHLSAFVDLEVVKKRVGL
jgi:hypothetical protein